MNNHDFPRVLLLAINYWPELTGIGKYTSEMAGWLSRQGVHVKVITAPPYYPQWKVDSSYSTWRYKKEYVDGIGIYRCPLYVPAHPDGVKRILHLACFAFSSMPVLFQQAIKWRPDVIFAVEPPLFCAPFALAAARVCGARSWLHVQDFEVDAAFELGLLESGYTRSMVSVFEGSLLRKFDRVTTISGRMMDRLTGKGLDPAKSGLFPNWVETALIRPMENRSALRVQWGFTHKDVVVLYSGSMGGKQGLELIVQAAGRLVEISNLHFVLCGEGMVRSRLEQMAGDLANVTFRPLQPLEKLNDLLNMADIHILPQRQGAADLVLPSKLSNMLASGRPVVATADAGTEIWEIVNGRGICVPPGDVKAFAGALEKLALDPGLRALFGRNARQYVQDNWNKEVVLGGFMQQLFKWNISPECIYDGV